jgi:AraC-like DNA-binding protein
MAFPIYQESGVTYVADNCLPVVRAVEAGQLGHAALSRRQYPGRRLSRNALPGVSTVGFWDAERPQSWGLDWHRNEGIEWTFLESGQLDFAVEKQSFPLQAGDLTLTRPWQRHRVGNPNVTPSRLHFLILDVGVRRPHQSWRWPAWIVLAPDDLRQLTDILRQNEQPVWLATAELAETFRRIGEAVATDRDGGNASILAIQINQLLLSMLEMFRGQEVRLDETLSSVRRTVELFWTDLRQNLSHLAMEWTARGMARRCGMGVTSFTRHTRQLTNRTPMQYLNDSRLAAAADWLCKDVQRTVTDVALNCGFGSSQYFATLFRRQFHLSPREWRRSQALANDPQRNGIKRNEAVESA